MTNTTAYSRAINTCTFRSARPRVVLFCCTSPLGPSRPLSAENKWDETCIHVAAEHGNGIELFMFFLDFNCTGSVRKQKNSRGYVMSYSKPDCLMHDSLHRLTALEVAKPEFLIAFGRNTRSLSTLPSSKTNSHLPDFKNSTIRTK